MSTQTPLKSRPNVTPVQVPKPAPTKVQERQQERQSDAVAMGIHDLQTPLMIVGACVRALHAEDSLDISEEEREEEREEKP